MVKKYCVIINNGVKHLHLHILPLSNNYSSCDSDVDNISIVQPSSQSKRLPS